MAPNLEDTALNISSKNIILFMGPLLPNGPLSDDEISEEIESDGEEDHFPDPPKVVVPLEQNLRGLLVKVTGTEDLARVTQVKLRVIAHDIPLQHLSTHIPALRELILDGSILSTFRDLGCGLKNLKILKVNRCGIENLDGLSSLENLEELYAADNSIENPIPCAFLPNIKVIDLRRNRLKNAVNTLTFLTVCEKLEHIYLEGNDEIWQFPKYRQTVKSLLPALRSLDGITYTEDESSNIEISPNVKREFEQYLADKEVSENDQKINFIPLHGTCTPRIRPATHDISTGFTIRFPPKVFWDRPSSSDK